MWSSIGRAKLAGAVTIVVLLALPFLVKPQWRPICRRAKEGHSQSARCHKRGTMPPLRAWAFVGSCLRGTGVAMFDYADYGETLLKLPAPHFFCISDPGGGDEDKFRERFGKHKVTMLPGWPSTQRLDELLRPHNVSHVYLHKAGGNDGIVARTAVNLVHAVFTGKHPHGDRYARISSFVSSGGHVPVVPYLVRPLPSGKTHRREALRIAPTTNVLCRYGGYETFDIKFAQLAVVEAVKRRADLEFLFVNTAPFAQHERIRFLPKTSTDAAKADFIRTCDAMLHARSGGETFGLAIAEFAMLGKRVITARVAPSAVHIQELGERAMLFHSYDSLLELLLAFDRNAHLDPEWNGYAKYGPAHVMRIFHDVFLS